MKELERGKKAEKNTFRMESKRRYVLTALVLVDKALFHKLRSKSSPHKHLQVKRIYSTCVSFIHTVLYILPTQSFCFVIFPLLCFSLTLCLAVVSISQHPHTVSVLFSISTVCSPAVLSALASLQSAIE